MKIKRILGILLAVLMLTLAIPFSAFAEDSVATVLEYLVAPSQYTNRAPYGTGIDKTVSGNGTIASLGNFGGFVTYKMNEPIYNSDSHPYGVDFIVSGNAFNAALTTQEPGQVWVSQDGKVWYALAGSEHFEEETVWDYSLTYHKEESGVTFTDSLGDSGKVRGSYPDNSIYETVEIPENALTLSGVLLRKQLVGSTNNGIDTAFGYVDTHTRSTVPTNPYVENHSKKASDGMMDIAWAVDAMGQSVSLPWIQYVKVQTATFIDGGAFGEKSTEVTRIYTVPDAETPVDVTPAPVSVTIGGTTLPLSDDTSVYTVIPDGAFDVSVNAPDANVYIGNTYGATRHFESAPSCNIIRIVVQSGELLPRVYTIHTKKNVRITYSADVEGFETMPTTMTVFEGTAKSFGYDMAATDHNGKAVEGVTVFDALVTAQKTTFGFAFTADTKDNLLTKSGGFLTKAYGKEATSSGFLVNDISPNDGIIHPVYGTPTAYASDTAVLQDGDTLCYYFYKDLTGYTDYNLLLDKDGYEADNQGNVTLPIQGYCAMYYSVNSLETILSQYAKAVPTENLKIQVLDGSESVPFTVTHENGSVSLKVQKSGTFTVVISGTVQDASLGDCPVICAYTTLTVPEAPAVRNTLLRRIGNFFGKIAETKVGAALRLPALLCKICLRLADKIDTLHK